MSISTHPLHVRKTYNTIISPESLRQHWQDERWVIIDSRYDLADPHAGHAAYQKAHIPGALYVDLHKDLSGPPLSDHGRHPLPGESALTELFSRLGIDEQVQVVVYDAVFGAVAARLWWMLRYMGHEAVAVLDGGWQAWKKHGFATEDKAGEARPSTFVGTCCRNWLVTLPELAGAGLLLDSREPARFRGELEPVDPVAGHIPGAKNHFFKRNLKDDGSFQSALKLKTLLLQQYGQVAPQQVVFYCGSGVTACHNVLAAVHAGLPAPRLYVGSWSEWCADPERPIATGAE